MRAIDAICRVRFGGSQFRAMRLPHPVVAMLERVRRQADAPGARGLEGLPPDRAALEVEPAERTEHAPQFVLARAHRRNPGGVVRDGSPAECDQGGAGPDFQHDRAWARGGFHGCAEADGLAELVAPVERRWRILDLVARERRERAATSRTPSSSEKTPAATAAANSPTLCPTTVSGMIPHAAQRFVSATSRAKSAGWA